MKYDKKYTHLRKIREEEEIKLREECPEEIAQFRNLSIFDRRKMELKTKENIDVETIGEVRLDEDERELLKLPPKSAVRKRLKSLDMEVDKELCMAKIRYQLQKEDLIRDIEGEEGEDDKKGRKRLRLNSGEIEDLEEMERLNAEERMFFDPIKKIFDHTKKRATDLAENSKVTLPRPCDPL